MKNSTLFPVVALGATMILSGCNTTESRVTSNQPGPAVGRAIGTAVGAVGSNVVGVGVGMAEGAAAATKSTFTNERRFVRTWREEKTSDGRIIKVPVEIEVDENGRPIPYEAK
jgi:hypothetical protein